MEILQSNRLIAGVDEAGRGPLAGPVIAAAVILNPHKKIKGLADSKALNAKQREALFEKIRECALAWSFARGSVFEIDQINILQATFLAMKRAVNNLKLRPDRVLVDGNLCPPLAYEVKAIVKGDQSEACISAASIVAKVLRDRLMCLFDKKYPIYGFARHKGYPTKQHFEALQKYGPCRLHRKSFAPVSQFYMVEKEMPFQAEIPA